jgi:NADH:ubiquinone oxidoreductase subunit 6 (subunit J)
MEEDLFGFSFMMLAGQFLAVILSWRRNHSVLWLMLHGLLAWFYVIYFILSGSSKENETENRERKDREFKKLVSDLVQQQKISKNSDQKPEN